mmetsp:Transcript_5576/g.9147  ORF Transcript_5576/g.9147 Transcript_5576/m.9147 type:complete len:181 (+) Transcript_5576:94-636(+)
MPKFSEKANASTANPSLLDGREGEELKHITGRLMTTLSINAEKVEDYFNAFSIFPLDKKKCVTMNALKSFYERAGLDLSEEDCIDAMKAFTGNELTFTLDFETYVINMERWARKEIHTSGILHTAYDVFSGDGDDHRITADRLKFMFKSIQGPPLDDQDISKLVDHINVYCGADEFYGFI